MKTKNPKIKKEKPISFNQIFKLKKAYEKASELKDKTYKEYMNILNKFYLKFIHAVFESF